MRRFLGTILCSLALAWADVRAGNWSLVTGDGYPPFADTRAEEGGVTDCMTMPWAYYYGMDANLEQKLEGMTRFAEEVITPLAG